MVKILVRKENIRGDEIMMVTATTIDNQKPGKSKTSKKTKYIKHTFTVDDYQTLDSLMGLYSLERIFHLRLPKQKYARTKTS